jgi:uncharacterized protein (DUF302 family)
MKSAFAMFLSPISNIKEESAMPYCYSKSCSGSFEEVLARVADALKREGFGILTEIDVQATLKKKLGVDFVPYRILGACNPPFAYQALLLEPDIGVLLPCNVIVREMKPGLIGISAVDPLSTMKAVENPALAEVAGIVAAKLRKVIENF